jgi:hypothetical protein
LKCRGSVSKGKWKADREQQNAAWEMYVELVTRIAIQPLSEDRGLLREALTSLYSLFPKTRRILKQHRPRGANSPAMPSPSAVDIFWAWLMARIGPPIG